MIIVGTDGLLLEMTMLFPCANYEGGVGIQNGQRHTLNVRRRFFVSWGIRAV